MSEDENFLARWSRRKQERARDEVKGEEPAAAADAKVEQPVPGTPADTPAVELSKLPSLEEITAETDISAFLRQGVPADLARAALRRAWTSDPAIRDFVGLQENDWVFNKPGPDQGFGPLGPETNVNKLLAQVFGDGPKEQPTAAPSEDVPASSPDLERGAKVARAGNDPYAGAPDQNDAPHNKSTEGEPRHSHGGALPRSISES